MHSFQSLLDEDIRNISYRKKRFQLKKINKQLYIREIIKFLPYLVTYMKLARKIFKYSVARGNNINSSNKNNC